MAKEIIPYDSPEAAVYESHTLTGWWSRSGNKLRFWKDDEHIARYDGCTHRRCACGELINKMSAYTICRNCQDIEKRKRYDALERRKYAGEPLADYDNDHYYWSWDDVLEAAADGNLTADTMIVFAEPVEGRHFDVGEFLSDDLPEEGEVPEAIIEAAEALNKAIGDAGTLSWLPGAIVPTITPEEHAELAKVMKESIDG